MSFFKVNLTNPSVYDLLTPQKEYISQTLRNIRLAIHSRKKKLTEVTQKIDNNALVQH